MSDSLTLLAAERTDTGERVIIDITSSDTIRRLSDGRLLICPHCRSPVILKAGRVRRQHFAHLDLTACEDIDREPESDAHRTGKYRLYRHFSQRHPDATASLEEPIPETGQRADSYLQFPSGQRYALEFQQAENSIQKWQSRREKYQFAGVHDLWFLALNRLRPSRQIPFQTPARIGIIPVPRQGFQVQDGAILARELEKAVAHADGILYFLDPDPAQDELVVILPQDLNGQTMRVFRYIVPFGECYLDDGQLWTPLTPLLAEYHRYRQDVPLTLLD